MCHKEVAEGGQKKKSNRVKEQAYVQQARVVLLLDPSAGPTAELAAQF